MNHETKNTRYRLLVLNAKENNFYLIIPQNNDQANKTILCPSHLTDQSNHLFELLDTVKAKWLYFMIMYLC